MWDEKWYTLQLLNAQADVTLKITIRFFMDHYWILNLMVIFSAT
jgi:hypothetical protein